MSHIYIVGNKRMFPGKDRRQTDVRQTRPALEQHLGCYTSSKNKTRTRTPTSTHPHPHGPIEGMELRV